MTASLLYSISTDQCPFCVPHTADDGTPRHVHSLLFTREARARTSSVFGIPFNERHDSQSLSCSRNARETHEGLERYANALEG